MSRNKKADTISGPLLISLAVGLAMAVLEIVLVFALDVSVGRLSAAVLEVIPLIAFVAMLLLLLGPVRIDWPEVASRAASLRRRYWLRR